MRPTRCSLWGTKRSSWTRREMTLSKFQSKRKACINAVVLLLFWIAGSKEFIFDVDLFICSFLMWLLHGRCRW
uniref:Uncharacterized protein n=1 Tax=Picea sitchensis TaxID=3332 RepID=D5A891_PICSI|nr:unknown [Picea sitchensis]